jgi:hypothetical protein
VVIDLFRLTAATFSNILKKDMENNRSTLKRIFSSVRYLCMQGLAIRGKTEETSNSRQLLIDMSLDYLPL